MEFKSINIQDKEIFDRYLTGRQYQNILYNFTSLFIWQNWEPYTWTKSGGAICIKRNYYNLDTVLAPFSPDDQSILQATEKLIAWYKERGCLFVLTGVTPVHLAMYEKAWPGRFDIRVLPNEANYIYRTKDLIKLPGTKYRSKRNHLHRFKREYPNHQFVPLSTSLIPECRNNLNQWITDHDTGDINIKGDYEGINLALDNFGDLDYIGACLLVDGKVIAFTLAEALDHDTIGIHVEKADTNYHGAYAAINQFFARDYCQRYSYINRAEDMGVKGLRKAKTGYHPCRMEQVYQLRLKEEMAKWSCV